MIVPMTLALPCWTLKLDVLVGPPEGVTPLEDLVARGILAAARGTSVGVSPGADHAPYRAEATISYLSTLLCVPQRVIMEVVGTLWSKGHLTVDFESGGIHLSEPAKAMITSQQSLATGGDLQVREFLFEPVTGMIASTFYALGRPSETSIRLPLRPGLKVTDIPPADLVKSVQAALRNERQRRGRVNVLSVGFGSPALRGPERIVWLEVDVVARRDPENDRIQFTPSETSGWRLHSQQRLNSYFDQLMADEPKHPVVQAVLGQAHMEREPPADLDDLFHRMRRRLGDLEQIELKQVGERHKWLCEWTGQIEDHLETIRRAEAKVSLIIRPEGHAWTVNDLIDSARRQIVLVVPDPDPGRMRQFLPSLRRALDSGVQVVFIWGRSSNERLNPQVENMLDELHLRTGARLLRNPKSARTEACIVIQDDCRAIVGSHSSLGYHAPESAEVSILIEPSESGPGVPAAVADLLHWSKKTFSPWALAQRIEQVDAEAPSRASSTEGTSALNPLPASPMSDASTPDVDSASLKLWAAGWRDVYAGLVEARQQLIAKVAAVEVLQDAEHRTALWHGYRDAQYRLVVSDDRMSSRSAGPAVVRNLRERRAAGAAVHLIHPAPPRSDPSLQEFAGLSRGVNPISVRHHRSGGRLIIADNQTVLGSFSPFDDRHGEGIARRTSLVGVRIRYEPLAAELADLLGAAKVTEPRSLAPALEPPTAIPGAGAGFALLLQARSVPGQDFARVAAERLSAHDQPFEALSSWRDSEVPRDDLRRVAAAAIYANFGPPEQAERWLDWLIEDAWLRTAYVEAALLSRWEPDSRDGAAISNRSLRAAALLSAALETGPLTSDMAAAVFDLGDSLGAKTAGAASIACDVLVRGSTEHRELLGLLADDLSPAWRDFCTRVESFGSAPLPLSQFAADQNRAETERALQEKRAFIVQSIDKIEALRNRFNFETGVVMHGELFRTGGLLQRIRAAAAAGTSECQVLAPHLPRDVRRYIDEVIVGTGAEPMAWLKQINFLRQVESLVQSLRDVAATASGLRDENRAGNLLEEAVDLGKRLGESWDSLYAEARQSGRPYDLPAMGLLTLLNPLTIWAKEQP